MIQAVGIFTLTGSVTRGWNLAAVPRVVRRPWTADRFSKSHRSSLLSAMARRTSFGPFRGELSVDQGGDFRGFYGVHGNLLL